jgi:hypothetical protein
LTVNTFDNFPISAFCPFMDYLSTFKRATSLNLIELVKKEFMEAIKDESMKMTLLGHDFHVLSSILIQFPAHTIALIQHELEDRYRRNDAEITLQKTLMFM